MDEAGPPPIDPGITRDRITKFMDRCLEDTGSDGFVMGLSGGVDSAVLAYMSSVRHGRRTTCVIMPDDEVTPPDETQDGLRVARTLGMKHETIPIRGIIDSYAALLGRQQRPLGNLRARVRGTILYNYANRYNLAVLGSTDRSEHLLGYYTKFGDGAADATPIISLYKTQVREMGRYMGVPRHILQKKSSPHLWAGHTAESELGIAYDVADRILYCLYDRGLGAPECARKLDISRDVVIAIQQRVEANRHKREAPMRP